MLKEHKNTVSVNSVSVGKKLTLTLSLTRKKVRGGGRSNSCSEGYGFKY